MFYRTSAREIESKRKSVLGGLETAIQQAIADGSNVFISGMARGVDIWAAEIVLRFRSEGEDIKLICASPYRGFEKVGALIGSDDIMM